MSIIHHSFKRVLSILLMICILEVSFSGCDISSKHVEMKYEENDNSDLSNWENVGESDVSDWDSAVVSSWDDVDDYSDWVASQIIFENITDDYPIVECKVFDYRSNGKYFDGEKVYELVNDKFDVNSFVAKYAVGSGVIVVCLVLTVATSPTPICCFFAGAADASVSMAVKGAALGAATNAVIEAVKSEGDIESTFYGALEGSAEGYMWGALYGAATGGFNSKYCFTKDTLVMTETGMIPICDVCPGDRVYSFDEEEGYYKFERVSRVIKGTTSDTTWIRTGNEVLVSTSTHPYLTMDGWKKAYEISPDDKLLNCEHKFISVESVDRLLNNETEVYSLCVEESHTFIVGRDKVVVHNRCNPNEKFSDTTRKFPEDSELGKKYPKGVYIKKNGYPDFSPYAEKVVKFELPTSSGVKAGKCLRGDCYYDFKMANKAAFGIDSVTATPKGYTWHHCEDGRTMQLIPTDLHRGIGHDGGEKVIAQMLSAL